MANVIESRLTYIKRIKGGKHPRGLYRCICGVEKEIIEHSVNRGLVVSCGCYHKERRLKHGLKDHPLYSRWAHIKDRCYNINCDRYYTAGAKGIRMCDEWLNDFQAFYDWCIANGWRKGLHIDKDLIPKKLGILPLIYSPEMCSIVTNKENNNAKSNSRFIKYNGEIKTITEWSEECGVTTHTLSRRLKGATEITDSNIFRPARHKRPSKK